MVIGNDLDALLSAALLKTLFHWDVVGIYDYRRLWYDANLSFQEMLQSGRYLAVDLDICRASLPSLGHHVLAHAQTDRLDGHVLSLNPNLLRGIGCHRFTEKYPLAMIHFLLWLFEIPTNRLTNLLCWLADSAYINAQSHRFRPNVARWLLEFCDWPPFWEIFILLDKAAYEDLLLRELGENLKPLAGSASKGQVYSRHRGLSGWQCQWQDPIKEKGRIQQLLNLISELSDWQIPNLPDQYLCYTGQRQKMSSAELLSMYGSLDVFLEREPVFSYVFPYARQLNYTTFPLKNDN